MSLIGDQLTRVQQDCIGFRASNCIDWLPNLRQQQQQRQHSSCIVELVRLDASRKRAKWMRELGVFAIECDYATNTIILPNSFTMKLNLRIPITLLACVRRSIVVVVVLMTQLICASCYLNCTLRTLVKIGDHCSQ